MTKPVDKNKQLRARRDSKAPKVKKKISVNATHKNKKQKKIKSSKQLKQRRGIKNQIPKHRKSTETN